MCNVVTDRSQHQQQPATRLNPPELPHQHSTYSQATQDSSYSQQAGEAYTTSANAPPLPSSEPKGHVEYVQPSSNTLSNPDFLSRVEAVKNCRNISKRDMKHNDVMPKMKVDPESYRVEADGVHCTAEPAEEVPGRQ